MKADEVTVRRATLDDVEILVRFNVAMARETESRSLAAEVVRAGVGGLLAERSRGFYLVAEVGGTVAGSLMVTREWSDWRNGDFWWIQSVYVEPAYRRRGVFRRLHEVLRAAAIAKAGVRGLRLYVEIANEEAQRTYEAVGMRETRYRLFEDSFG